MNLITTNIFVILISFVLSGQKSIPEIQVFNIDGKEVRVTHTTDRNFFGKYSGAKGGYLNLNEDGTGEYQYDYYGYALPSCQPGPIIFNWGLLLDKNNQVVKFDRDYGYSYPIIYQSSGTISFQGCRKKYLVDYLMVRKDGSIGVSSSDDWEKNH